MTNPKPTPDLEAFRFLKEQGEKSPRMKFLLRLNSWISTLLDGEDLPRTAIALEAMASVDSAVDHGLGHDELSSGYPVAAWREETVEIPRAWLRVLVEGWQEYKSAPSGTSFGEAMGMEGGGQGKLPVRSRLANLRKQRIYSNEAIARYLAERGVGGNGSWERACADVAEALGESEEHSVSEETVSRALGKQKAETFEKLKNFGLLEEGVKTSGSTEPD